MYKEGQVHGTKNGNANFCTVFTITAEISRAYWLIFIVNKWTDTRLYNSCYASTNESEQLDNWL